LSPVLVGLFSGELDLSALQGKGDAGSNEIYALDWESAQ
jgi:hypothetical protein